MNSVFKALADPTRRHVLELLRSGPKTAGELADSFPVSKPAMSAHFTVLREAGLIGMSKSGKMVIYELRLSVLEDALLGFASIFKVGAQSEPSPIKDPAAGFIADDEQSPEGQPNSPSGARR